MGSGKQRQYLANFICQLSVFVAGIAYSGFEPFTIRLTEDPQLSLDSRDVSWLVSFLQIGAIISSLISGKLSDRLGRKWVIRSTFPLFLLGWVMMLISKSMLSLSLVRISHGMALGMVYTVVPIYTAEIAEPNIRGRLAGNFQIAVFLGLIFTFSLGPYLSYDQFVYACLPWPIISMIVFWFIPETPYYFLMRERVEEARKVLKWLRDRSDVEEELTAMQVAIKGEMKAEGSWTLLFTDKVERKAFFIVQIVCITKYMSGIPVITNYTLETFAKSESSFPPEVMSIALILLLAAIAVLSAYLSDRIGRKPLLLVSCFGSFFSNFLTGGYYYLEEKTTVDTTLYVWMMYIGIAMYCFFCGVGIGPLVQTLQAEMFGASTRGVAAGITEGMVGVTSCITLLIYRPINEFYGIYLNFFSYGLVGLVGGLLLTFLMYETSGKVIGQMDR